MSAEGQLPAGFERLEPFVAAWARPGTAERARLRGASAEADRLAFYEAARALLPEALAYLDGKPLDALGDADQALMDLMLALAHVALAVEVQGPAEAEHHRSRDKMRITRTPADRQPGRAGRAGRAPDGGTGE